MTISSEEDKLRQMRALVRLDLEVWFRFYAAIRNEKMISVFMPKYLSFISH